MLRVESDPNHLLFQVAELIATAHVKYLTKTGTDPDAGADFAAAVEHAVSAAGVGDTDQPENAPWHCDALLQLVGGSRRVAELLRGLEVEAARQARRCGATVGELAAEAGISVRAANDRYRRVEVFNPDPKRLPEHLKGKPFRWDPEAAQQASPAEGTELGDQA